MVALAQKDELLLQWDKQLLLDNTNKVLAYSKGENIFAYNFNPTQSFPEQSIPVAEEGSYKVIMSTDDHRFGGFGRIYHQSYATSLNKDGKPYIKLYLPSRTAAVLIKEKEE